MIELSVIIPNWNTKEFLKNCIHSIIKQVSKYQFEIIVVDNASHDGSKEFVKENFPQVKLICNDINFGFAKACNIGIKASTGKYIFIINSDVEVLNGCFDSIIKHMENDYKIGLIGPQILDSNGNIQRSTMGFPTLWNTFCRALALDILFPKSKLFGSYLMTFFSHNTIQNVEIINGSFWAIRRETLDEVGLLDERFFMYGEDKDWCKRFWDAGYRVVYFPDAKVIHYGGGGSSKEPIRFYIEMHHAYLKYWEKYYDQDSKKIYLIILFFHNLIRFLGGVGLYLIRPSKKNKIKFNIKRSLAVIKWLLINSKGIRYEM